MSYDSPRGRWVALHCSDEAEALQRHHPNAFLLLCQIARRARWKDCPITKLKAGEALIGDWREAGLASEMAYRVAKKVLVNCGLATFCGTSKGTRATLSSSSIFTISSAPDNGPESPLGNAPATDGQQADNDPTTTNHKDTKTPGTQRHRTPAGAASSGASSPATRVVKASTIAWTQGNGFQGISVQDRDRWARAYPAVQLDRQIAAASEWLLRNPAKRKKDPGRFLSAWLARRQERGGDVAISPPPQHHAPPGTAAGPPDLRKGIVVGGRLCKL